MRSIYQKIEFWSATIIYLFAITTIFKDASNGPYYSPWMPNNTGDYERSLFTTRFLTLEYSILPYLSRYTILYLSYLLLTLKIIPALGKRKSLVLNIICIVVLFISVAIVIAVANTYLQVYLFYVKNGGAVYYYIFVNAFGYTSGIFLFYGIYACIKYNYQQILIRLKNIRNVDFIIQDCLTALSIWLLVLSYIYNPPLTDFYSNYWIYNAFFCIPLYFYLSAFAIPSLSLKEKYSSPYQKKFIKIIVFGSIALTVFYLCKYPSLLRYKNILYDLQFAGRSILFHLLITLPASWNIYHQRLSKQAELEGLKTALNQSTANMDFLRSQINPHFLYNALNTLYGTALHEKSDRTAQGIQKLGDMMRFMLHENHQSKIMLQQEIRYISNYIDLQLLRTQASPDITVETEIPEIINDHQIAPMLLIPFIENAFKHGISLTHKSWIKIKLHADADKVYFNVNNSIHLKAGKDPEKDESGIGLENVKQRLALLYPGHHELIITETDQEFSVHLAIDLDA